VDSEEEEEDFPGTSPSHTADDDVDVDIGDLVDDVEGDNSPPTKSRLKRSSSSAQAASTSKLKRVKLTLPETEYQEDSDVDIDQDAEDDFIEESEDERPKKGGKVRPGAAKGKPVRGRGKGGAKLPVRGSKTSTDKDIIMKDERRLPSAVKVTPATAVAGQKRAAEDADDRVSPANTSTPSTETPAAKKQKLPPIKKNKPAGSTNQSTTSTPKPAAAPKAKGTNDLDLNDSATYLSLFSLVRYFCNVSGIYFADCLQTGAGPRSAAVQKEENRKKEIQRMKEEARARRLAEMVRRSVLVKRCYIHASSI
jgi:cell division septation protein DedD